MTFRSDQDTPPTPLKSQDPPSRSAPNFPIRDSARSMLTSARFFSALVEAGIVQEGERIRRVVIDCESGRPVRILVERIGDERLIEVLRPLAEIGVHVEEPGRLAGSYES